MSKYALIKEETAKYLQVLLNAQPGLRSAKRELSHAIGQAGAFPGPIGYSSAVDLADLSAGGAGAFSVGNVGAISPVAVGDYTIPLFRKPVGPELTVWVGRMLESNGKSNYTAMLCRLVDGKPDIFDGITIHRSEYPGRCQYEADEFRWMIGDLEEKPCITEYDTDKRSDYVESPSRHETLVDLVKEFVMWAGMNDIGGDSLVATYHDKFKECLNGK